MKNTTSLYVDTLMDSNAINKVFVLSMMKSGISSATEFLKQIGYTHMWPINNRYGDYWGKDVNNFINPNGYGKFNSDSFNKSSDMNISSWESFHFFSDQPISFLWKDIVKSYPNSKFILTDRPVDDWYNSFRNHHFLNDMMADTLNNVWHHWLNLQSLLDAEPMAIVAEGTNFSKEGLVAAEKDGKKEYIKESYIKFNNDIKEYFSNKNNLFYSPLYEVDSKKLYEFLNVPDDFNQNIKWGHYNKTEVNKNG